MFRNLGHGLFSDVTYPSHVGAITMPVSGWSMGIFDFDNDGWKDVFVAAGDVQDNTELFSSRKSRQQNLLLLNDGHGGFRAAFAGPPALNRGVAFGDFDRDGRVDAVVTRLNEPPVLLRNIMGAGNHWIALNLIGARSNRDGIGARVAVRSGGVTQVNRVTTSTGYACSSESAVHFGLGRSARADSIEIEWPSGSRQALANVPADSYLNVISVCQSRAGTAAEWTGRACHRWSLCRGTGFCSHHPRPDQVPFCPPERLAARGLAAAQPALRSGREGRLRYSHRAGN